MVYRLNQSPFGIYVHWPFCQSKCPYCDFNSHVSAAVDQSQWREAFTKEIHAAAEIYAPREANTVFFGGGTPSLMEPKTVHHILTEINRFWPLSSQAEITLEANPTSVDAARFAGYAASGVNRLSLGVQALDDNDLRRLGRQHTADEALQAIDIAKKNFASVSFDLIYARQHQSLLSWRNELKQALDLEPNHLSLYQLTIEPNTVFGARQDLGKLHGLPPAALSADQYELTQSLCEEAGLPAYEVSNHAKSGFESRHNLVYWRYHDYLGLGPGAHGRYSSKPLHKSVYYSEPDPKLWLRTAGSAMREIESLTLVSQATEYLMMSLRLKEGCDLHRLKSDFGFNINALKLSEYVKNSLLTKNKTTISATAKGRIVLNSLILGLIEDS